MAAALAEPTPIGEIIIGGILLGMIISQALENDSAASEKPEEDTVPSETPDDAATPDTPAPTIEDPQEKDRDIDDHDNSKEWPENPDDWTFPEGMSEEDKAKEATGGRNRQWKDKDGSIVRRWDEGGRESGKERGSHWHDSDDGHIPPGGGTVD